MYTVAGCQPRAAGITPQLVVHQTKEPQAPLSAKRTYTAPQVTCIPPTLSPRTNTPDTTSRLLPTETSGTKQAQGLPLGAQPHMKGVLSQKHARTCDNNKQGCTSNSNGKQASPCSFTQPALAAHAHSTHARLDAPTQRTPGLSRCGSHMYPTVMYRNRC